MSQPANNKLDWRRYQVSELEKVDLPGLKPAFPGSLLCNHILVPAGGETDIDSSDLIVPDISHVIYEYCDGKNRNELFENALIIDADGACDSDSVVRVVEQRLKEIYVGRIVLLGRLAFERYGNAIQLKLGRNIEIAVFEPDWMSAVEMHSVYRQAVAGLFINTMRVLDAAISGCQCNLMVGDEFQREVAFAVLHQYLHSVGCKVVDESGCYVLEPVLKVKMSHLLVENSIQAVQLAGKNSAATGEIPNRTESDWYEDLNSEVAVPVIKPYSSTNKMVSGLRDSRTRISRKAVKLFDNPAAFFRDSRHTTLRIIGRVFRRNSVDV